MTELQKAESHTILPAERLGDTLLVVPHGDLGGYSPTAFQTEFQRVQELLKDETIKHLIIDLGGARYFGSEMIGAMVALRELVIKRGRTALTDVSPDTRVGLDVIQAATLFEFFDTRSQAVSEIATLTVGERVHRHRRPIAWIAGLLVVVVAVWGMYVSGLTYRVFGSRTARVYEEIARSWKRFEQGRSHWTEEELRVYRAELLDEVQSWKQNVTERRLFPVKEDRWLKQALLSLNRAALAPSDMHEGNFYRYMGYSRFFIEGRTGLELTKLGPKEYEIDEPPPPLDPSTGSEIDNDAQQSEGEESEPPVDEEAPKKAA